MAKTPDVPSPHTPAAPDSPPPPKPPKNLHLGNAAAGMVGACALAVSAYTAYLQRQQVRAQVWPVVAFDFKTSDEQFSYGLSNVGTGPATISHRSVAVLVDGQPVRRWNELLDKLAPRRGRLTVSSSTFAGHVLGAGVENKKIFEVTDPVLTEELKAQAGRVTVTFCYCSVLEECWVTGSDDSSSRSVRTCPTASVPFQD